MRTKVLICAAVLAASLASSMAQNVYSLNVVGYVNVTLPANAFSAIANPFNAVSATLPGGNNITNLFNSAAIQDSSTIQTWDPAGFAGAGDWTSPITYIGGVGWDAELNVPPGKGILFYNNGPALPLTFVGEVIQGPYTVATLDNSKFTLLGGPAPVGGSEANVLIGLTPEDSDTIQKWDPAGFGGAGDWTPADTFIGGAGWDPGTLTFGPADAFLYYRNGGAVSWQSNFTVQ